MDFSTKSDKEIDQWIANHERAPGGTSKPLYRELLEERARRAQDGQMLNLERSLEHLKTAAIGQICTTYGDLAKASGVEWTKARQKMNGPRGHLDRLLDLCYARGLPLLTAICVNRDNVADGELDESALAGFAEGARRLGLSITDERSFHRRCREECWAWGREQAKA